MTAEHWARFADFLALLSLDECGAHLWHEDILDAAWAHSLVFSE